MLKALQNSELKVGSLYLGYHITDGVYIFRYLGKSQWSSGISVGNFMAHKVSKYPYEKNKGNVLVFMEVFHDPARPLHVQCQDAFKVSQTELVDAMLQHKNKWFGSFKESSFPNSKTKTKYKIVNSLEPLYRTA